MTAPAGGQTAAAPDRPAHGSHCPRCGNGVLYLIAETEGGSYLACFNCETRGTIPHEGDWVPSVDAALESPTGFVVTHDQLAAQKAVNDPEQAQARSRAGTAEPSPDHAAADQAKDDRIAELQRQLDEAKQAGGEHA